MRSRPMLAHRRFQYPCYFFGAALAVLTLVGTFAARLLANLLGAALAVWTSFAGFGRVSELKVVGSAVVAGFAAFGLAFMGAARADLALLDTFAIRLFANVLGAAVAVWSSFVGFGVVFELEVLGSAFVAGFAAFGLA